MAKTIFTKILNEGLAKGKAPGVNPRDAKDSVEWYRARAKTSRVHAKSIIQNTDPAAKKNPRHIWREMLGKMYMFTYVAEHRDTLPYWDQFPLVIPTDQMDDGFLGLNFHYLDYRRRAVLLDALLDYEDEAAGKLDREKIVYRKISGLSKYKYFRPCLKRYKFPNIRGRMIELDREEWQIALFLPVSDFNVQRNRTVWGDSLKKVK